MKCAFFGFPKVGKTTIFNLLTRGVARTDKFGGRSAPNIGQARVPDERVDRLIALFKPLKTSYAQVEYADVAGVSSGELSESVDLATLRTADALIHVVRAFDDPEIDHVPGSVDPRRDIETMETELQIADLIVIEKRLERLVKDIPKLKNPQLVKERDVLERMKTALEDGRPARSLELDAEEEVLIRGFTFLSGKPQLIVVNFGEEGGGAAAGKDLGLEAAAARPHTAIVELQGKLEMEVARLDDGDRETFMAELGLGAGGLDRIIRKTYELLGLISFFTVGEDEVKAWTLRRGLPALKAAGTIHSDIERGFIRAEVVAYDELLKQGSLAAARSVGTLRLEGKEHIIADGDVVHFRFNVG